MEEKTYIDGLIEKAREAQALLETYNQEQVDALVRAMGKVIYDNAEKIAKDAVAETGYGRVDSKILKVTRCTTAAWHYMHDKKSVGMIEWDPVEKLATFAKPLGIVAALVPTTNPVSTTVSNGMSIIKCRNAMIVSPHPRAKNVTAYGVQLMNEAILAAGGPKNLIQIVEKPSMEATAELMKKVDVVVATGGAPMVKSAYSSGRPSFGVGPGNVQVVVAPDYTDYDKLARQVISSRSYDNGMPCTGEQALHIQKNLTYKHMMNTLYSYVVMHKPFHPSLKDKVPYIVGAVDLAEGVRISVNMFDIDPEKLRCGVPVTIDFLDSETYSRPIAKLKGEY